MSRRPDVEVSPVDRRRLAEADRHLHEAVTSYEHYLDRELTRAQTTPEHDPKAMAAAQAEVEAAEGDLWRLREEVLGWARPPWAPRAALVADWFSAEDAVYDDANADASWRQKAE
jgi:hypothetical protein